MNKDKFQDKYDEVFRNIKEEKMDWDFEDFLKKAEGNKPDAEENPMIPITKAKPSFPKWFWMAACVVAVFGIGFLINQHSDINDQAQLVENQIKQQKKDFIAENNEHQGQVAVNHINDSIADAKKDSVFQENTLAEKDLLDDILPKRGRLKKEKRPKYADNATYKSDKSASKDSTGYRDSYVIVNGKRIENVEEAINVTKYSFQILANNVSEKIVQPKVVDDDY